MSNHSLVASTAALSPRIRFGLFCGLFSFATTIIAAESTQKIKSLDLKQLMSQQVALHRESNTASGVKESILDMPGAMIILSKSDIQRRGYLSIDDIIADLPGFDHIVTNGTFPSVSYQRGYRTPGTQRTLLLINGKVDNHLWSHTALLSKQYPMQAIERVEVLYGPAGAVYGPNAFLGVINIITRAPETLVSNESYLTSQLIIGDDHTYGLDFTAGGNLSALKWVLSGRLYQSDGPDINDYSDWGYLSADTLQNSAIWGSAIANSDFDNDGSTDNFGGDKLGVFGDTTDDHSLFAEVNYRDWTFGVIYWRMDEDYGPFYPSDKAQANVPWLHESKQFYLDHRHSGEQLLIDSQLLYRIAKIYGYWAENAGGAVSLSNWNTYNDAWLLRQDYQWQIANGWQINAGFKYEEKRLTKAYTVCGYWEGSLCAAEGGMSTGANIRIGAQRNSIPLPSAIKRNAFDPNSKITTTDIGFYGQAIVDIDKWRINFGLRWDHNSEYGAMMNPRGALIYHYSPSQTYKLVYGQAFQEASPRLLYGGWTGRQANPDLQPETVRNLEAIAIFQTPNWLHDISFYYANYDDVIVDGGSGNIGGRDILGFEYRGKVNLPNPLIDSEDIVAQIYYTFTNAQTDHQYFQSVTDDENDQWITKSDESGDIAPHKIAVIIDVPLSSHWGLNLQWNWLSERELFSQNPLRAEYNQLRPANDNRKAKAYLTLDAHLGYKAESFDAGIRIENVLSEDYLLPGVESADSGDSFGQPSNGFNNSLVPQVNKPKVMAYFTLHF